MADPNLTNFFGRVARIQKARAKEYGFDATGTLGRSHYSRPAPRRRSVVGPVLFLLVCGFLLKGVMYQQIGAETYSKRVANLMDGERVDRVGGWLMQVDPVTTFVAGKVDLALRSLK